MQNNIKEGDLFYIKIRNEFYLRKIVWVGEKWFESSFSFFKITDLKTNPNKNSKVKFLIEHK